jgi:selenocysteine lyase/cysteine desulfurase
VRARELGRRGCYTWNGNFYALNLVCALGLDEEQGMLRIGFTHYNTCDEVGRLLDQLAAL